MPHLETHYLEHTLCLGKEYNGLSNYDRVVKLRCEGNYDIPHRYIIQNIVKVISDDPLTVVVEISPHWDCANGSEYKEILSN